MATSHGLFGGWRTQRDRTYDVFSRVGFWHDPAKKRGAEQVCSARVVQTSTCSAIVRASSTSIPRYRTVLSTFVWPSSS